MGQLREFEKFFDMAMWQFVGSQRLDFGRVGRGRTFHSRASCTPEPVGAISDFPERRASGSLQPTGTRGCHHVFWSVGEVYVIANPTRIDRSTFPSTSRWCP